MRIVKPGWAPWQPSRKSIFRCFSWTERSVDSKLVGSIWVTCRSKIAKIMPIVNPRWPPLRLSWKSCRSEIQDGRHVRHLENLFFASSPEPKGQLTPNLLGSIRVTCRSKIAKIVPIWNPRWPPWPPSWKSIFRFFSWTERPIDSKLGRKHQGDLSIKGS